MNISDLKSGQGKVDITAQVKSKAEPRSMQKFGKELKVANAIIKDESGEIKLTLWNDDVDKVNMGDTIKITNGYVSEFNGAKQLSAGKFGKLEVVNGDGNATAGSASPKVAKKVEPKKVVKEETEEVEEVEF